MNRTEAARIGGMDRQALRRRVLRFNADGLKDCLIAGLRGLLVG